MKSIFSLIVLCTLLLLTPFPANAEDWSKVRMAIEKMNDRIEKAVLNDDVEPVLAFYTEDATSMPAYEPQIKGKNNIREHLLKEIEGGFKYYALELKLTDLTGSDNLAIETGEWSATFTLPGNPEKMSDKGKYLTVWEKQTDGSWKIKIETWNSDSFPMRDSEKSDKTDY